MPIRLIELEENHGVAFARQAGLDSNECEFVCFLDSDDMFMPYTVDTFLREMRRDFPQVLYTDFFSIQNGNEILMSGERNITWFHGKCYRNDFLQEYSITVPQVLYNEDSGFATTVHELAERKAYLPVATYAWTDNPNSITHSCDDFEAKSLKYYIEALSYSFDNISMHFVPQSLPVFYCQLNNMYEYHMQLRFSNSQYLNEVEEAIKNFFKKFWIESTIRPKLLLFGFSQHATARQRGGKFLTSMSQLEWISKMSEIEYTIEDFQIEEEEEEE